MRIPQIMAFPIAAAFALFAAGCLAGCHKAKPAPSIDGLSEALDRSAEKELPAPSLADEQIIVPAKPGQIDAQTAEIVHTFAGAGASAVSSVDGQGRVSIMGSVPENEVDAFKAALRHEKAAPPPSPSTSTRLIEVLIESVAASPSP
jgi:hypothetical protein